MKEIHMTRFKKTNAGFTLIELMVVAALLAMLLGATIPSMVSLFSSGADSQAVNLMSAQLTAARALAMRHNTYAGVHVQMGVAYNGSTPEDTSNCYIGIIKKNSTTGIYEIVDGYPIQPVPGTMAFGQVSEDFLDGNEYDINNLREFCRFSIVFSPTGSLVVENVTFDEGHAVFVGSSDAEETAIWRQPSEFDNPHPPSVTAVTVFDFQQAKMFGNIAEYLNENGQFLPINVHTGLLHPRR